MKGQIQILSPYVGGAFGPVCARSIRLPLAVMAALKLKRSVRVSLNASQMVLPSAYARAAFRRLAIVPQRRPCKAILTGNCPDLAL